MYLPVSNPKHNSFGLAFLQLQGYYIADVQDFDGYLTPKVKR